MREPLFYVASPYSHEKAAFREVRAERAAEASAALNRMGFHIFAPIPHGHMMAKYGLPTGYEEFWKPYCHTMLSRCDALIVLMIGGWKESIGVQDEILYANEHGMLVFYISETEIFTGAIDVGWMKAVASEYMTNNQ